MFKHLQKLLLIALLCVPWVTQAQSDSCTLHIVGEDSYGDGWNGGTLTVTQGSSTVTSFTLSAGSTGTTTFTVAADLPVTFSWSTGSYDSEVSFSIYNAGNVLLYYGNYPSAGTVFTLASPCSNCFAPSGPAVDSLTSDYARVVWGGTADEYGIIWGESADVAQGNGTETTTTDNFFEMTDLSSGTGYTLLMWTLCDNDETSDTATFIFATMGDAISEFPYTTGFEAGEDIAWSYVNDGTNKWYIGAPGANTGSNGLFISNDNGSSAAYTNSVTQFSYAYRELEFDAAGQYAVSFDWKANGESNYDYLRAWIAPASAATSLTAGHDPEGGTSAYNYTNSTPSGWIDLGGKMNLQSTWQTIAATPSVSAGSYILVFMWANDGSGGSAPSACVDNIYINELTCPAPTALAGGSVNSEGFTVSWTAGGSETEWAISLNDSIIGVETSTSYTFTGLNSNTLYTVRVYAICGADDTSMATTVQVRTACGDITELPVTYNFDNQATGTNADFAYCWTRLNSAATYNYYPYIYSGSSYAHSGSNNLYIYSYTSADYPNEMLAILPPIDSTLFQVNGLELLFWAATSSSSYYPVFEAGVYVDNDDTTYFQPYDTISVLYSNGLAEYSVIFNNYEGPHGRLAFRFLKSMMTATYDYCYLYMDDVTIREANDCLIPANFTVNAANPDSVMVTWQEMGEATTWEVVYGVAGFNPDTVTMEDNIIEAYDTVAYLENLPSGITYQVYVRANCGDGYSYWAGPLSFTPGSINMGVTGNATMYVCNAVIYDDGGATGNYSLSCESTLTLYPNDDTKRFKFWGSGYTESCCDYLQIYAGTAASGTLLGSIQGSGSIDTVTTQGGPITLRFHSDGSVQYDGFELHVMCEDLPPCRDIAEVTVLETSTSSAYVTWTNAVGTTPLPSYYIVTVYDSANSVAATVTTPDMFAIVGGLDANTDYTVTVVPDCDGSTGMPASTLFTTAAFGCYEYDTAGVGAPYQIGDGTGTSYYLPIGNFYNYSYTQQIFDASEFTGAMPITGIDFEYAYTSSTTSKTNVSIYLANVTETSLASGFVPYNAASFKLVYTGNLNASNGWNHYAFDSVFYYDGTSNLLVVIHDNSGSYNGSSYVFRTHSTASGKGRYVQNDGSPYTISSVSGGTALAYRANTKFHTFACSLEATCAAPLFVVTGKTVNSVDLMWAAGADETTWNVEHRAAGDANWVVDLAGTTLTSTTVTGLNANTLYEFRVYNLCGTDTFATVRTVRTDCSGESVPFSEHFTTWSTSSSTPAPSCWFKGSSYSDGYPYGSSSYSMGDGRSIYFYASGTTYTYLALPKMDAPIDTLVVSGFVYYSSNGYIMNVGVMTDAEDFSTFHTVGAVSTVANTWQPFEFTFVGQPEGNIAFYVGNGGSYQYLYLDNVEVNYMNPCIRPTNLTTSNITQTTANVSWTDTAATNFVVEYGPAGFAHGTGTEVVVSGNSTQLTGLTHSIMYDVYVRGICGDGDTSNWSFAHSFATSCGTIDALPRVENFDTWGTGTSVHAPLCWAYGSNYSSTYPYISTTAHSGAGAMYFYDYESSATGNTLTWFALPELDSTVAAVNQTQVFFYTYTSTSSYEHNVMVGVSTTPSPNNAVWIDTVTAHYGVWEEQEIAFDSYTGNGRYIVFATYVASGYNYSYPYVDDLTLEMIPSCQSPNDLTASNATSNSVDLGWNDRANASQWEIEYGPIGFTPGTGTTVIANSNPYTLTGLPSSYQGEYYVRAICSASDSGAYSRHACGFNTTQAPATLPYNYDFESADEWANWQHSTNIQTVDWYRGTAANTNGNTSQYSMYVSADQGATYRPYTNNAVVNAAVYRDVDFGANQSSFTLSFDARAGGTIDARYDALMVFLVDPAIPTVPSSSGITSPWGNVNDLYRIALVYLDTNWTTYTCSFDTISGVRRVAFFWFNQNTPSYATYPEPAAVDNIHIEESACPRPVATTLTGVSSTTANLSWTGATPANYEVIYRPYPGTPAQNVFLQTQTNSITLTGLEPMSEYVVWVRKLCTDDTSLTSDAFHFNTEMCDNAAWFMNYDTTLSQSTSTYSPIGYSFYNYGYVQTIVDSAYIADLAGDIAAMAFEPTVTTAGDEYENMTVYLANIPESTLTDWILPDDSVHVFQKVIDNASFSYTTTGIQLHGFDTVFTWDGHSNILVSVVRNNGSYTSGGTFAAHNHGANKSIYAYRDSPGGYDYTNPGVSGTLLSVAGDIYLVSCGAGCRVPSALSASNVTYNGATLNWSGSATQYEVAVKAAADATWPEATVVNNATTYNVTGLNAVTPYQFRVRAICDETENLISDWAVANFVTDSLPCFDPSDLQATAVGYTTATLAWTSNGIENQWSIHVWNSTFNEEYTASANPFTVTGLTPEITYNAAVKAICGNGAAESEYSDTIQFTTATCMQVTGVTVGNITNTTAVVNWNGGAARYEIEYGDLNFDQGTGTRVPVDGTTYTITGLEKNSTYSVFVRAICEEGVYGAWSTQVDFTTTNSEGISTVGGEMNVDIFPNPTSSSTTIALSGVNGEVAITVVDMNGRVVMSDSMSCEGDCVKTMEVKNLAQGAYFVRISGEGVNMVKKLVVK